jgi:capsular polysaccharide biosynthesis protein
MQQNESNEEELSLLALWQLIKQYHRSLVITPLVFGLIALIVSTLLITPRFEATGTIQIGQVNQVLLEPSRDLEVRMNDHSFAPIVVNAHLPIFLNERTKHTLGAAISSLRGNMAVKKIKDTDMVSFSVISPSKISAAQKAQAVFVTLQQLHGNLYNQHVDNVRWQIDKIEGQIDSIKAEIKVNMKDHMKSASPYTVVLDSLVVNDQYNQMRSLTQHKFDLQSSLNPAVTFNTKLLGTIDVSDEPISPNVPLMTLLALLLGLFLAVVVAFIRLNLHEARP